MRYLRALSVSLVSALLVAGVLQSEGPRLGLPQPGLGRAAPAWSTPVNLSHSGAADSPQIVASADGKVLQAFWWDRFDGVTTARFNGKTWSNASAAPIRIAEQAGNQTVLTPIGKMPTIVADSQGAVHAFFPGKPDLATGVPPLMHTRMLIGATSWPTPTIAVDSATAFDVVSAPSGKLILAYVRMLQTPDAPSGVYVRRSTDGGASWSGPAGVYRTTYFRLLTEKDAYVRASVARDGTLGLVWHDPRLGQALYARSTDEGATWSAPESLGQPEDLPARPRVVALSNRQVLRLWEASARSGCTLYEQYTITTTKTLTTTATAIPTPTAARTPTPATVGVPTATVTATAAAATATVRPTLGWSDPEQVFADQAACPQGDQFWVQGDNVLWLWGQGTATLSLAEWEAKTARWSVPQNLSFHFQESEFSPLVELTDLHATLAGGMLVVVGSDLGTNEVWATTGQVSAVELIFAPPPPWSTPVRLSQEGQEVGWPAVALDTAGGVHVVWSQASQEGGPDTSLFYARLSGATGSAAGGARWSNPVAMVQGVAGQEMARQPALLADDQGVLHLVWSGGSQGQIFYSRAQTSEASSPGGWSTSEALCDPETAGSWPQIGIDATGRLYVVYAVPLNEQRGLYLVSSDDGGKTWSPPTMIFDAAAAGQAMVSHPTLAVAPDGTLHVAWVQNALPGTWPAQGIAYTWLEEGTDTWPEPREVAGAGYDWPQLALAGGQMHLLYAQTSGGSIWHRMSGAEGQSVNGWGAETRVPNWKSAAGPFGLIVTGSPLEPGATLHLVGVDEKGEQFLYSLWDGVSWSAAETFPLGVEVKEGLGLAAAALPQGGQLAVALRALPAGQAKTPVPAILFSSRTIPTVDVSQIPTPEPTAAPLATPSPTVPPTVAPSPTPNLAGNPPAPGASDLPLAIGVGLAAAFVVVLLVVRGVWGMRR